MSYFTASQIGKALAKARVSAGLSQVEIARRIEKGERTVQSWEKGCTSPDAPHPPIDDLKINYKAGRAAAESGAFGYIGQKKE